MKEEQYAVYPIIKRRAKMDNGLYPINVPTGGGKTTATGFLEFDEEIKKKIIFVSNNRKNTEKIYQGHKEIAEDKGKPKRFENQSLLVLADGEQFLEVYANPEYDIFKLIDYSINENKDNKDRVEYYLFKNGEGYKKLKRYIESTEELINSFRDKKVSGLGMKLKIKDELLNNETYKASFSMFKKDVSRAISKKINYEKTKIKNKSKDISEKKALSQASDIFLRDLFEDDRYPWITLIFPYLELAYKNSHIKWIYCNIDKFCSVLNLMVPGKQSFRFYEHDFIKNSIVIIDESDDCYKTMQEDFCIKESIKDTNFDIIEEFRILKNRIQNKKSVSEFEGGKQAMERLNDLRFGDLGLDSYFDKTYGHLGSNFKSFTNPNNQIIFFEGSTKVHINNDKYFALAEDSLGNEIYAIFGLDPKKEKFDLSNIKDREKTFILSYFLDNIEKFNKRFLYYLRSLLRDYIKMTSENKSETFIPDSAYYSVLRNYISNKTEFQEYMMNRLKSLPYSRKKSAKHNKDLLDDPIYAGFKYYYLTEDVNNFSNTELRLINLKDTPEKILFNLSTIATVIPMSATIDITSRYANFDFNRIEEWLNDNSSDDKEHFYWMSKKEKEDINEEYEEKTDRYDSDINLSSAIMKATDCDEFWEQLTDKNGDFDILKDNKIYNAVKHVRDPYYVNRFKSIIFAYRDFLLNGGKAGVFLSQFNIYPSAYNKSSDNLPQEVFESIFKEIDRVLGFEETKIFFVNSETYDAQFKKLSKAYNNNKRVILFTSYKNLTTGQDLSIKITNNKIRERLKSPTSYFNKYMEHNQSKVDFNYVYLSNITHLGIRRCEAIANKTGIERVTFILQEERALSQKSISNKDLEKSIISVLTNKDGKEDKDKYGNSYNKVEKTKELLRIIKQAIGRISRNSMKEKDIRITLDDSIFSCFSDYEIASDRERNIPLKELKVVYDCILERNNVTFEELIKEQEEGYISHAEESVEYTFNYTKGFLEKMARSSLTKEDIDVWEQLRKIAIFPFFESMEDVPEFARGNFIELEKGAKEIFWKSYGREEDVYYKHSIHRNKIPTCETLSPKETFLYKLSESRKYKLYHDALERAADRTFDYNKEYKVFPNALFFQSITLGAWGEFIGEIFLKTQSNGKIRLERMPLEFYETFDSKIEGKTAYIDFKNWRSSRKVYNVDILEKTNEKIKKIGEDNILVFYINSYDDSKNIKRTGIAKKRKISNNIYNMGSIFYNTDDTDDKLEINPYMIEEMEKLLEEI